MKQAYLLPAAFLLLLSFNLAGQNVGIGTTAPTQKLHVQVDNNGFNIPLLVQNLNGTQNGTTLPGNNSVGIGFLNESNGFWYKAAITHERTGAFGIGKLHFLVNGTGDANPTGFNDTRMTISSTGTGIGTTDPQRSFVVKNTLVAANSVVAELASGNGDPNFHLVTTKGDGANGAGAIVTKIGMLYGEDNTNFNSFIRFHRGGTEEGGFMSFSTDTDIERMRIDASGNVGIGTSSFNTGEKFALSNGTIKLGLYPGYLDNVANNDWVTLDINGSKNLRIWDRLSVANNVGIGVTNPVEKLEVAGTTKTTELQITQGAVLGFVLRSDATGNATWVHPGGLEVDPQVGTLTHNIVPKWSGPAFQLTDGLLSDNGVGIGIGIPSTTASLQVKSIGATGPPVVDQQQTTFTGNITGTSHWQSFTAGATGLLTKLELNINSPVYPTPSVGIINIRAGEGPSGQILTSFAVVIQPVIGTFQSFSVFQGVVLQSGTMYTIQITVASASVNWILVNNSNPYANGRAGVDAGWDYGFKTYIAPSASLDALSVRTGNVGIGTPIPAAKLDVSGDVLISGGVGIGDGISNPGEKLRISGGVVNFSVYPGYLDATTNDNWTTMDMPGALGLRVWDNLSVDGNVGIGVTDASDKVEVAGKIRAEGYRTRTGINGIYGDNFFNFNWTGSQLHAWVDGVFIGAGVTSDRRLKEKISLLDTDALNKIMQLKPVSFLYKDVPGTIFRANPLLQEGFVADELQEIIPSAVTGEKNGLTAEGKVLAQTVNITPVVAVLTKAVQEQQKMIEELKMQIEELKKKIGTKD